MPAFKSYPFKSYPFGFTDYKADAAALRRARESAFHPAKILALRWLITKLASVPVEPRSEAPPRPCLSLVKNSECRDSLISSRGPSRGLRQRGLVSKALA
jgi:hypothetical protein